MRTQVWSIPEKVVQSLSKNSPQTVYAQFDHAETASVMISEQNLKKKTKGEHHWTLFVSNPKSNCMKNIKINSRHI